MTFRQIIFAISISSVLGFSPLARAQLPKPATVAMEEPSVIWQSGLTVKVCQLSDAEVTCEDGQMPELLDQVTKVLTGKYIASAKASWIALSNKGVAVCYILENAAAVNCIRVKAPRNFSSFDISALPNALIFKRLDGKIENETREEQRFGADFIIALHVAIGNLQAIVPKNTARGTGRTGPHALAYDGGACSYEAWIHWACDDDPSDRLPPAPDPNPAPPSPYPSINVPGPYQMPGGCVALGPVMACNVPPIPLPSDPAMPTLPTTAPPPLPPSDEECTNLNDKVQAAKDVVGDFHPARCKAGMSLWQLLQRKNAWLEEASARAKRDQKCWNGGDDDHQRAQAAAWNNAQNCGLMANPGTLP